MVATFAELMARRFDPTDDVDRRWATPGQLAIELDPKTRQTPALEHIDAALVQVANGTCQRQMILMPPQEGKTARASVMFPTWVLADQPNTRVAIVSFGDSRAREIGREIRDNVDRHPNLGIRLRQDSKAAGRFKIAGYRGSVYCTSVAGSLVGQPVDLLIIDDPIQDLDHALSPVYRERAWRFWQGTAVPRLAPTSKVVLIQTRWHESDLAGRLLAHNPGPWQVLSIPAIAESADDPLGRVAGEAMKSARGVRDWDAIRKDVGEYVWAAEYQQRPAPSEGGLFKRAKIRHWAPVEGDPAVGRRIDLGGRVVQLNDTWRFLTVDLAASLKTSADFTVAGVWAIGPDGDLILLDGIRARLSEASHWPELRTLRERHRADVVFVESRMFGTTMVYEAGREGVPVVELKADTDKVTRALPATARADAGKLWFPSADTHPWVTDWVDELAAFPNAAHDDVTDVVAYAARVAAAHWLPAETAQQVDQRRALAQEARDAGEMDLMSVPY